MASITVCDRCGCEIVIGVDRWGVEVDFQTREGHVTHTYGADYCITCWHYVKEKLEAILKEKVKA